MKPNKTKEDRLKDIMDAMNTKQSGDVLSVSDDNLTPGMDEEESEELVEPERMAQEDGSDLDDHKPSLFKGRGVHIFIKQNK